MRTCEDGCNGCDECTDYDDHEPHPEYPCRHDGRCQYAIDHGAEDLGHCPRGKCVMADEPQSDVAAAFGNLSGKPGA